MPHNRPHMVHCERCEVPDEGSDLRRCCWCDSTYCDSCLTTRGIDPKTEDGAFCSIRCRAFSDAGLETNATIEARFTNAKHAQTRVTRRGMHS